MQFTLKNKKKNNKTVQNHNNLYSINISYPKTFFFNQWMESKTQSTYIIVESVLWFLWYIKNQMLLVWWTFTVYHDVGEISELV